MKTVKWSSNRYVSEEQKKQRKETRIVVTNIALVIAWSIVMFCIGFDLGFNCKSDQKEPKRPYFIYQKIRG